MGRKESNQTNKLPYFFGFLRIEKITFQTFENQNCFIYTVEHNGIFDSMYFYESGNLLNIRNVMLKYPYSTKVALNFKETL